jgi:putative tricarboxylic transport membrane protein
MHNTIDLVLVGFQTSIQPMNLLLCFVGCFVGTLIGVLPGIGPAGTIALLLPATFRINPVGAIIMLAGIYYGAAYGGSTTSILVNIPGEVGSVVTCLDGYQMTKQGRAGPALGAAAFGSFIAGTVGVISLMVLAPELSRIALKFGPPEYCALIILALAILTFLSSGSMAKSLLMAVFGLLMGCIGIDPVSGTARYTFHVPALLDGVGIVNMAMGLYGIAEVFENLEQEVVRSVFTEKIKNILPNLKDWKDSIGAMIRGSFIGCFLGILPGGGAIISSFLSYAVEKKLSKHPEMFGKGAIAGVAAPEAANNGASQTAFIPLLSLGIPGNSVTAVLMGALIIHGVQPGPLLIPRNPELFWGVVMSMYIGNVMLLILNLPLIRLWVQVLKVPYRFLFPLIIFFTLLGSYATNYSVEDLYITIIFGVIGYLLRKFDYQLVPIVLAYILTPLLEQALRQSLLISDGSFTIFLKRPLSLALLVLAFLALVMPALKKRVWKEAKEEQG